MLQQSDYLRFIVTLQWFLVSRLFVLYIHSTIGHGSRAAFQVALCCVYLVHSVCEVVNVVLVPVAF